MASSKTQKTMVVEILPPGKAIYLLRSARTEVSFIAIWVVIFFNGEMHTYTQTSET